MVWGVIGGLVTSTVLTLLVIPILYHLGFVTQVILQKSVQGVAKSKQRILKQFHTLDFDF